MPTPAPQTDTIPAEALRFTSPALFSADTSPTDESGKKRRTISGTAYSGDVIAPHWYWDAVVFDISGVEPLPGRIPLLVEHDREHRVGHTSLAMSDKIELADAVLLSNERAQGIAQDADEGFPWQLSVHIEPLRLERLEPRAVATVNGRQIVGPAIIFRASRIREVSLTPTGADHRTSAQVFSAATGATTVPDPTTPTVADLQAQVTKLSADLATAQADATAAKAELTQFRTARRTEQVKQLFSATGKEFSDAAAAPYLDMTEQQFSAVAALIPSAPTQVTDANLPSAPTQVTDANLFRRQADGASTPSNDPAAIAQAAQKFKAEQAAAGIPISDAAAVAHVTRTGA